ncbi:PREDICTED: neural cell adhesion molecule 1-like isoform X2 [Nicrophorus vespilloides]|uniref:Neural cell adhesion molecule 1-like isoform X2 n=1 Tax=Nicrophorus vespilloides TaxID=110193 RepID=A0ABM1M359_NICVS|nr:PREDICTED: neural cell adhesion molecule 1-like isoform X2 [Nicrophorus vespilloides]
MKYEISWIAILFASLLAKSTSAIYLSHANLIKSTDDSSFLVTCRDDGGRPVTWSGPRGLLGAKSHPRVDMASYGTSIFFQHVAVKDSGNYTCSSGSEQKTMHLTVKGNLDTSGTQSPKGQLKTPLTFMDTSPNQTGIEFTDVTLRCEVKGGDKPIVTWSYENGGKISDPKFTIIGDGLLIKNVTRNDSRTYICKAMQTSTGDIMEQKIQLKVEHKPSFRHKIWVKTEEAWAFIGGEANLTCEVYAEPPATFQWLWKKQTVQEGFHNTQEGHIQKSVLQIFMKDSSRYGNYVCMAKNKLGTLEKIFSLQPGVQPPPPEYIELRGENSDLLDLGIGEPKITDKIPSAMSPTGYRVQYRPHSDDYWKEKDYERSEANSYPLLNLKHDTDYEVRAATINKAGISDYTNISNFRTLTLQTAAASTTFLTHVIAAFSIIFFFFGALW